MSIQRHREKITEIDHNIIKLINQRYKIVQQIGREKLDEGAAIYVPERETALINQLCKENSGPMPDATLRAVYREIISGATALERPLKISYFGLPGSFTNQAAIKNFGHAVEYISRPSISDVFKDIETGRSDYGCVPVENSTEGSVSHTLDRLMNSTVLICAEVNLPIHHHLMAKCALTDIKKVYSHIQVMGQCRNYLYENMSGVEQVIAASTTQAAKIATEEPNSAAIASRMAAEIFGLEILEPNIEDFSGNTTRFLILGRQTTEPTGNDKTSICFATLERAGALYDCLKPFNDAAITMTMIESRPAKTANWEYCFLVDIDGHREDETIKKVLSELQQLCKFFKILGSYPKAEVV
jgi:chorismate mutase/prephenate dehydratase